MRIKIKHVCSLQAPVMQYTSKFRAKHLLSNFLQKVNQTWQFKLQAFRFLEAMRKIIKSWRTRKIVHGMKLYHLRHLFDREKKAMM